MSERASLLLLALYFSVSHCLGSNTLEFNDELYKNRFQNIEDMVAYLSDKTFVTERLSISLTRADDEGDINQLAQLFIGEEWLWMFFLGRDSVPGDAEAAKKKIKEEFVTNLDSGGNKCCFTIKLKDERVCIGQVYFELLKPGESVVNDGEDCFCLTVGYWIGKNYSNKGYMSEICPPMLKFCFDTYEPGKCVKLLGILHEDNTGSYKLLEKIFSYIDPTNEYVKKHKKTRFRNSFYLIWRCLYKKNMNMGNIEIENVINPKKDTKENYLLTEIKPEGKLEEEQNKKDKRLCSCCPCR